MGDFLDLVGLRVDPAEYTGDGARVDIAPAVVGHAVAEAVIVAMTGLGQSGVGPGRFGRIGQKLIPVVAARQTVIEADQAA